MMIIIYLQESQYSEVRRLRRPFDGIDPHTQEVSRHSPKPSNHLHGSHEDHNRHYDLVNGQNTNGKSLKSPKQPSNLYSPRNSPISSNMKERNGKSSRSPRQSSNYYSPRNSITTSQIKDQNIRCPRFPRELSNAYPTRNNFALSPTRETNVKTPRTPRQSSNDYSPRNSVVVTSNTKYTNHSPRPTARHSLPNENEYIQQYSVTKQGAYRPRSAAQRKNSDISDSGKDIQPVPAKRNSCAYKDTSSPTTLSLRNFPMPPQLDQKSPIKEIRSTDSVHAVNLDQEDCFFDRVMAYERSKEKKNSLENGSNGNIRHAKNIIPPRPKSQEPITSGHSLNPQTSVKNSYQTPHDEPITPSSQIGRNVKSPNKLGDNDFINRLHNIDKIIIPSKNASNDEKLSPSGFSLRSSVNTDQKSNGRKSKSPSGFLDYSNGRQEENYNKISSFYEEESPIIQNNLFSTSISPITFKQTEKANYSSDEDRRVNRPLVSPRRLSPSARTSANVFKNPVPNSDKRIVVIDMGHYYMRIGILRDQPIGPDFCIPNSIALTSKGLLFGDDVLQIADPEANEDLGTTSVISPLRQSQIVKPILVNGVPIQKLFFQNIFKRLNITEKGYKLLLCLPTRASALRPYFLDYFLGPTSKTDQQGLDCFEAVATISAFRAALQTAKISTCLIISLNADLEIIPIAEGTLLEHGRSTTALYGEMALRYFLEELVNAGVDLTEKEIDCYGPYIYQKAAFIENQRFTCEDVVIDLAQYAPYPLDKQIKVSAELRRKASDALLRAENAIGHDGELPPFSQLLRAAIQSCDLDLRSSICSNVIIIGEFAELEGFQERVQDEIRLIITGSRANVQVAPIPAECVYEGACLLTALLQGPYAPKCPWFCFLDDHDWYNLSQDAHSTGGITDTRLLSRLNRNCVWP
ncbi:unnamed protein product [Hymenolepis diminuta]|uniref:Uncharacterized protein n=1 Tax=Hymenolepis diminuta TaxID=6216 RepID=A0A564ZC74_HYMDI|nr:unnamed protein product [Hymenolepis diminuta]